MQRDAHPGGGEHPQVVRPVPHGDRVGGRHAARGGDGVQRLDLRRAPQDRQRDAAGELAVFRQQHVRALLVKTQHVGDRAGEIGEPARHQRGPRPLRAHRGDQRPRATRHGDAAGQHVGDDRVRQPFQQRHARDQGRVEVEFAVHRPGGDRRHRLAEAGDIGEFVQAFLLDHGRIHVRQQHRLAPPRGRHDGEVEAAFLPVRPDPVEVGGHRVHGKLGRDPVRQPQRVTAVPARLQRRHGVVGQVGAVGRGKHADGEHRSPSHSIFCAGLRAISPLAPAAPVAYPRQWDTPPQRGAF